MSQNLTTEERVEELLDIQNDKVTLGKIIQALIFLSAEIPSEGGSLIKMIRNYSNDNNLGLDFITPIEQLKLALLDIEGLDPAAPPLKLNSFVQLASDFIRLNRMLQGDPNDPTNQGLIQKFHEVHGRVDSNEQLISALLNNPILSSEEFTVHEKSKLSKLDFLDWDPNTGEYINLDRGGLEQIITDVHNNLGGGSGGGGAGLDPADKAKLDRITITTDHDIDQMAVDINKNIGDISNVSNNKQDSLGVPTVDDQILSSKTDGTISWVDSPVYDDTQIKADISNKEDSLGVPQTDDQILSSKTDGTKAWIDLPQGIDPTKKVTLEDELVIEKNGLDLITGDIQVSSGSVHASGNVVAGSGLYGKDANISGSVNLGTNQNGNSAIEFNWVMNAPYSGQAIFFNNTSKQFEMDIDASNTNVKIITPDDIKPKSGDTNNRPADPEVGEMFFDTDLSKPIWCKTKSLPGPGGASPVPAVWVDATGTTV